MNKTMIRIVACFVMLACSGLVIIRDREARNATLLLTDGRVIEKAQAHIYASPRTLEFGTQASRSPFR
jgi:hypothetical protein